MWRARPRESGNMAALTPVSQLSSGNPAYENFYRQVDPGNTGKVSAADAATFLKRSGLADSTLGQIWDLSDPEKKGYLDKRGFFMALRMVASAQGGNEANVNSLPIPRFRDAISPSLNLSSTDSGWMLKPEDKSKYDGIFESLAPIGGLLSGDQVKPVLMNSNLPLDVLGKIWNLSDIDKDGSLDKDEFSVAMHLVYAAREKEPLPSSLPPPLIPPSKRKKAPAALPGSVPVLPSSPFLLKDMLRPTHQALASSPLGSSSHLLSSDPIRNSSITPPPSPQTHTQPSSEQWLVPTEDREQYEQIFDLADSDFDGLVGGGEVKDIFMNSRLPQSVLAHIWSLADTKSTGKLSKEQFCLAMHLIQEAVEGVDPPKSLTPDMIPPSERVATIFPGFTSELTPLTSVRRDSSSSVGLVELTGNKDLDDVSHEISQLKSEKRVLETEIRKKEEVLRQKNGEIQNVQRDLDSESIGLQELELQKQDAQDRLCDMEQQKAKLESSLDELKKSWQEESSKMSSLQAQLFARESDMQTQEKEVSRTRTDLYCLEQEEQRLQENLHAGKNKLESVIKLLRKSQDEMDQTRSELGQIQESQRELRSTIDRFSQALSHSGTSLSDLDLLIGDESITAGDSLLRSGAATLNNHTSHGLTTDPFQSPDPFQTEPFNRDPFGGDPFQQKDPFKDSFTHSDAFSGKSPSNLKSSPFRRRPTQPSVSPKPKDADPFAASDPFSNDTFGSGFADFSHMSKVSTSEPMSRRPTYPLPPPKKPGVPQRPAPPPYGVSTSVRPPLHPPTDFTAWGSELQQMDWAKRESERDEAERVQRLRLQEQQDLELALALSRAQMPKT